MFGIHNPVVPDQPNDQISGAGIYDKTGKPLEGRKIISAQLDESSAKISECAQVLPFSENGVVHLSLKGRENLEESISETDDEVFFESENTSEDIIGNKVIDQHEIGHAHLDDDEVQGENVEVQEENLEVHGKEIEVQEENKEIQEESRLLENTLIQYVSNFGFAFVNLDQLRSDVRQLVKEMVDKTPEEKEELLGQFIEKAIKEKKIHKLGANGEKLDLTPQDMARLRQGLKNLIKDYLSKLPTQMKPKSEITETAESDQKIAQLVNEGESTLPVRYLSIYTPNPRDKSVIILVTFLDLKQLILKIIIELRNQERVEEKREAKIRDIAYQILRDEIMRQILKSEILNKEIGGGQLKFELNHEIGIPLSTLVNIIRLIFGSNMLLNVESEKRQLPGPRKITRSAHQILT